MSREAMKLALEALKNFEKAGLATLKTIDAITAIKQALEQEKALQALHNENERLGLYKDAYGQPEPEPVAWMNKHGACMSAVFKQVDATAGEYTTPLYTSPPKRKPLPVDNDGWYWLSKNECIHVDLIRKVEAAHGIKGEA